MKGLVEWLMELPDHHFVELFEVGDDLQVETHFPSRRSRKKVLKRSGVMEEAIISVVNDGLSGNRSDQWQGLFYVMGIGELPDFTPLYIGITRKAGGKHSISANIKNIATNKSKFARWGDSGAYHIGDLSKVLFQGKTSRKYEQWAQALFDSYDPPVLKEPVYLYVAPWYDDSIGPLGTTCTLDQVEKEMIRLAYEQFGDHLSNTSGIPVRRKRKTPLD